MNDELTDKEIGEVLKAYRTIRLKWTQKQAAEASGIAQSSLSLVEKHGVLASSSLDDLLTAYGLTRETLEEWGARYYELASA